MTMLRILAIAGTSFVVIKAPIALAGLMESSVPNAANQSAVAGANSAVSKGPNALLSNPAGIASDAKELGQAASLSIYFASGKAPISEPDASNKSKTMVIPLIDYTMNYPLNDKVGLGAGVAVAGGQGIDYGDVTIAGQEFEVSQVIGAYEFGAGAGYKISDSLSAGLAWRVTQFIPGELHVPVFVPATNSLLQQDVTGLSGNNYSGFRLGFQYQGKGFGVGLSYRSAVDWNLKGKGKIGGQSIGDVEIRQVFPHKIALGGYYELKPDLKLFAEIDQMGYSANKKTKVIVAGQTTETENGWKDQISYRLGVQSGNDNHWPIRGGLLYETAGVPKDNPTPFTANGDAIGLHFGTATSICEGTVLNLAAGLSHAGTSATPGPKSQANKGDYTLDIYSLSAEMEF